jgi:subtilisin family serine protease
LAVTAAAAAALAMIGTSGIAQASDRPDARPVKIDRHPAITIAEHGGRVAPAQAKQQTRTWFVQFKGHGAADLGSTSRSAVESRRGAVQRQAASALGTARGHDSHAARVFTLTNSIPGVAIRTNGAGAAALAKRADVVSVRAVVPRTAANANAAVLQRAVDVWRQANGTGKGVKIGIIDTGIDYTHADFGGVGTSTAYDDQDPTAADWRSTLPALGKAKIKGGYDFAGDDYQANDTLADGSPNPDYQPNPNPDNNPLDCNEHGTHVAGTTAGYGVGADGKTFKGSYAKLGGQKLIQMNVGPGMAPRAELYGLKVFGCDGSTDLVLPALDWALDPNGDGDFSDHLDIVNMSLGSDFGPVDDPENAVVNELAKHGVLSVISAGNAGDITDVAGTPGTAASALTVAASVDAYQLLDGLKVNSPADAGVVAGQFSVAYDWDNEPPVSGDVVKMSDATNLDGCQPFSDADAAAVEGKVAWLTWDSNDATRRCGSVGRSANAKAAGAIGAIFTGDVKPFGAGITGDEDIPVFQLTPDATENLDPAATAGTLKVTFDGSLRSAVKDVDHSIDDTLASFSSRGAHGSLGVVKPDVAAVGDSVASAGIGSGNQALSLSGTSMAAPNTTGIAALVKARHPQWGPLQIKAAVMNTATHDVWTGKNGSGHRFGPARVGSGRVDALNASRTKVLAYRPGHRNVSSVVFGVVPVGPGQSVTKTAKVRVVNAGKRPTKVALSFDLVNAARGVHYKVSPSSVTVKGHGSRSVTVTMKATARALRHQLDPTMATDMLGIGLMRSYVSDASGYLVATPKGHAGLRLPVYTAAKPTSDTTAVANAAGDGIDLSGQGFSQGHQSRAYSSLASVLQLGATSGKSAACSYPGSLPGCEQANDKATDIKAIGAGQGDGYLQFGIATWGDSANFDALTPYVDFDTDGDDVPDYEIYVTNLGAGTSDLLVAETVDYNTGEVVDDELLNNVDGSVDTNVWDTNVVLLPVDPSLLDISAPITYTAGVFNGYTGLTPDVVSADSAYDTTAPDVDVEHLLWDDQGGTTIPVTAAPGAKALVFHLHGQSGARDEVVSFPDTQP